MFGLTARWSLEQADGTAAQALRDYVADTSFDRFTGMPGLHLKTWRMRPGEWFEGTYVWESEQAREAFAEAFTAGAATSPVSLIVGEPPVVIETWEVVAVAEGGEGLVVGAGPGHGA